MKLERKKSRIKRALNELETRHMIKALKKAKGHVPTAAKSEGMLERTFWYRLNKLKINPEKYA